MWAEVKRGNVAGSQTQATPYSPSLVAWDTLNDSNAPALTPTGNCALAPTAITTGTVYRYAGLQYYRSFAFTSSSPSLRSSLGAMVARSD